MLDKSRFVGKQELPWDEDDTKGDSVYWDDVDPVVGKPQEICPSDLVHEFELFNAGLLSSVLGNDVVALYFNEYNIIDRPVLIPLNCIKFKGLPAPYDRVLFACPKNTWPGLARFLARWGAVAQHDNKHVYWQSVWQLGKIVDPVKFKKDIVKIKQNNLPTININLYGLSCEHGEYVWTTPKDLIKEPTCLIYQKR